MPLNPFEERLHSPLARTATRRTSTGTAGNEEGHDYCRICRGEGTSTQPLYYPCKCSGSIKFVHQECLMEWLSHSQKKYCELCKTSFRFTKLYDGSMPATLPFPLFLRQLARHGATEFARWSRYLLVSIIWTCCLPWCIRQIWRGLFWLADGNWVDESTVQAASNQSSNITGTIAGPESSLAASLNLTVPQQLEKIKLVFPPMQISLADIARLFLGQSMIGKILRFILSIFIPRLRQIDTPGHGQNSMVELSATARRPPSLLSDVQFIATWSTSPMVNHVTVDVIEGQLICVLLVAAFILVFLIREWVINQQPILNMPDPDENPHAEETGLPLPPNLPRIPRAGDNVADELAAMEHLAAQLPPEEIAPPRPPPNQHRIPRFGDNIADEIAALERLAARIPPEDPTPPTLSPRRTLSDDNMSNGIAYDFDRPVLRTRSQSTSAIAEAVQDHNVGWGVPGESSVSAIEPWNLPFRRHSADDTEANHYLPLVPPSRNLVETSSGDESPIQMEHYLFPGDGSDISDVGRIQYPEHQPVGQEDLELADSFSRRVSFAEVSDVVGDATNGLFDLNVDGHGSDSDAPVIPTPDSNDADQLLQPGENFPGGEDQEALFDGTDRAQPEETLASNDDDALGDTTIWGKISHWLWHTDFEADDQLPAEAGDPARAQDQDEERIVEDVNAEAPFVPIQNRDAALGPVPLAPIEEPPAAPPEAREPNMLFGVDLNEPNPDDAEDLDGILELLGMEGPIFGMVQNVIFSLFLITVTLSASVWCPYIWGKIALLFLSSPTSMLVKAPIFVLSRTADIVVDIIFFVAGLAGFLLNQPLKIMRPCCLPSYLVLGASSTLPHWKALAST
ncbi:RING-variant domain-containing protein [Cladophialophora immunda]|nr:RING-variant domain-containing protein [Cladophialophora immunda]